MLGGAGWGQGRSAKLEAMGLITMREIGGHKVPVPAITTLRLEIAPSSDQDVLEFA